MDLAILPDLLGQFGLKMTWLSQNGLNIATQIKLLNLKNLKFHFKED
jgi:hypothetical protein